MAKRCVETPVKGGWVVREATTDRLVAVRTEKGVAKARASSELALQEASSRRSAALKRLADR